MRIQSITPFKLKNFVAQNNKTVEQNDIKNNAYNPIAYNDLTFTARLFRSPENFYAQPFNKNGMPDTMKEYLNADYSDRQKMPPAQMLKLVFDDINETKNLEQVKRIFPDESLFNDLTDIPNKKARTGVLAEIDLMREENKSLFKNGKDNLGHYILKKIYTEAKTLKEINADFKKDVSVHYNGLSPIEYDTLRAFGIKFPNNSFWKSLTATREEFPYEYKPRKPIESRKTDVSTKSVPTSVTHQKKRFGNVKEWEIDSFSDALIYGNGSSSETIKRLRKSSVRDEASLSFVAKYMGEINSVVLEKLHISPEMSEFFENYDGLSKSQKQKLNDYWKHTDTRELRSTIMKDTIKLFFDAYGVDGQNDEFKELIEYAHSIKPNRIAMQQEHNRIQAEYDEMFAALDAQAKNVENVQEEKSLDQIIDDVKKDFDVQEFKFDTESGRVVIFANLRDALKELIAKETSFMPTAISNKFNKFVVSNYKLPDSFILSKLLLGKDLKLPEDDRLMPNKDVKKSTHELYQDFSEINMKDCRAAQQAVVDGFLGLMGKPEPRLFTLGLFEFVEMVKQLPDHGQILVEEKKGFINSKFNEYRKPLSESEVKKVSLQVIDLLRQYNPKDTIIDSLSPYDGFEASIYSVACYMKNQNPVDLKKALTDYVREFGGSARFFLDKNADKKLKMAKLEQFMVNYVSDKPIEFHKFVVRDSEGKTYIQYHNPELYFQLFV